MTHKRGHRTRRHRGGEDDAYLEEYAKFYDPTKLTDQSIVREVDKLLGILIEAYNTPVEVDSTTGNPIVKVDRTPIMVDTLNAIIGVVAARRGEKASKGLVEWLKEGVTKGPPAGNMSTKDTITNLVKLRDEGTLTLPEKDMGQFYNKIINVLKWATTKGSLGAYGGRTRRRRRGGEEPSNMSSRANRVAFLKQSPTPEPVSPPPPTPELSPSKFARDGDARRREKLGLPPRVYPPSGSSRRRRPRRKSSTRRR